MNSTALRRRQSFALLILLALALAAVGGVFAAFNAGTKASAATTEQPTSALVSEGKRLFQEGCSSCHGLNAQGMPVNKEGGGNGGPSLIGVGAAAVDFQVSTGRMPLAGPGAQAPSKRVMYSEEEIAALAAYVASLAPGPAIPTEEQVSTLGTNLAEGGELFRTNCAQCHNFAGRGGALTNGAFGPSLMEATPTQIYEAMITGPQNMPVFSNATLNPEEKKNIIAYIEDLKTSPNPGGIALGRLGPVTEGLFLFTAGMGALIAVAIWIGAKVR